MVSELVLPPPYLTLAGARPKVGVDATLPHLLCPLVRPLVTG
jgi:hypothetical protein